MTWILKDTHTLGSVVMVQKIGLKSRLDRALVSDSFIKHFAEARLINIEISTSDHSPILLMPRTLSHINIVKNFRFKNAWLRDPV